MLARAKSQALRYLTIRARSTQEVKDYLKKKGHLPGVVEEVLAYLVDLGYLNDDEFCKIWIEERIRFKPMGKKRLYYELQAKGIDGQLVAQNLEQLVDAQLERELALSLFDKKIAIYPDKNKMARFLYNRGFASGVIWQIINEKNVE